MSVIEDVAQLEFSQIVACVCKHVSQKFSLDRIKDRIKIWNLLELECSYY